MGSLGAWPARVSWLVLPVLLGPAVGDALDDASRPVQLVASVGLWVGWAVVLVATLVLSTVSLTTLRVAAPAAVVVAVAAIVSDGPSTAAVVGLAAALVAALAAFWPGTGEAFVAGSSYGGERRMPLRVPGPLLAGPLVLVWAVAAAGVAAGPLLLAARQWLVGLLALAIGLPAAAVAVRSLHTLARRWLVFVPNGVVVHDPLALAEPVLLRRADVRSIGPAPADTAALDLTRGALGLALELTVAPPVSLVLAAGGGTGVNEATTAVALLVSPTRPGAVLAEARSRRLA
ncbi:MAG TPA: hypothetical protein VKD21_11370 [Acidimicrobiales bacterium]|nr:hypothetical protein [Acidimicrobiales bacterium]